MCRRLHVLQPLRDLVWLLLEGPAPDDDFRTLPLFTTRLGEAFFRESDRSMMSSSPDDGMRERERETVENLQKGRGHRSAYVMHAKSGRMLRAVRGVQQARELRRRMAALQRVHGRK